MNGYNLTSVNSSYDSQVNPYSLSLDEPLYKQFKPQQKDLIALPKAVVYLLMAGMVVVGVAYAIVGHLIKDLAIDIADCVLGPIGDEDNKDKNPKGMTTSYPPSAHPFAHNAFHVWDQDDVIIPLPQEESPQLSPLLLAAMPYIPSFFPHTQSPTSHSSMTFCASPGSARDINAPGRHDPPKM